MAGLDIQISQLPTLVAPVATDLFHVKRGVIDYKMTFQELLKAHLEDFNDPHLVSKAQVGLPSVIDTPQLAINQNLADIADVGAAQTNLDVLSVAGVSALITSQHGSLTNNPHQVSKAQVGLPNVNDGTWSSSFNLNSTTTYATSKAVFDGVNSAKSEASNALSNHLATDNPHGITLAYLGIPSVINSGGSSSFTSASITEYANSKAVSDGVNHAISQASTALSNHTAMSNPHNITKAKVGLSDVLNSGGSSSHTSSSTTTYANSKAVLDGKNSAINTSQSSLNSHIALSNPHNTSKGDVGLGNVLNSGGSSSFTSNSTTTYANSRAVSDGVSNAISQANTYTNEKNQAKHTVLMDSPVFNSDFTLSESFRNFEYISIYYTFDDNSTQYVNTLTPDQIDNLEALQTGFGYGITGDTNLFWRGRFVSDTYFDTFNENCVINRVVGTYY